MLELLGIWNIESMITTALFFVLWTWVFIFRVALSFPSIRAIYHFRRRPEKLRDIRFMEWKHYWQEARSCNLYPHLFDRFYLWSKASERENKLKERARANAEEAQTAYQ